MWQHRGMLLNPRYGRVGCVAMPFFTFGEMLAPVVEVAGYLITAVGFAFHLIDVSFALLFVLVAWGYGMLLSLLGGVLGEGSFRGYWRLGDLLRPLRHAVFEAFGDRQLDVWWGVKMVSAALPGP